MKLFTLIFLFSSTLTVTANLLARQDRCSEDDCWRAVWGTFLDTDHPLAALTDCQKRLTTTVAIFPITTITVVGRITTTAVVPCSTTSSSLISVTTSASSLPEFTLPTPTASSTASASFVAKRKNVVLRQNEQLSSSTTTIVGSVPTYAAIGCRTSALGYASACSCKTAVGTRDIITTLGTMVTSTDTFYLTSTTTTAASCSAIVTVTMSYNSSTSLTTMTMTSNSNSISTGTGTVSISSLSSSSSFSTVTTNTTLSTSGITSSASSNTTASSTSGITSSASSNTTASSTSLTSFTSLNSTSTTSTSSATPTPVCSGLGNTICNGACHDLKTDVQHCGRCNNACSPDTECVNGVCARTPCDSTCTFDRSCNSGNNATSSCICATDQTNHGICFDKNRYKCTDTTLVKCLVSAIKEKPTDLVGCPIGQVCVKDYCNCGNSTDPDLQPGICVSTAGCGDSGVTGLGPLVWIGDQEKRRRMVGEFDW